MKSGRWFLDEEATGVYVPYKTLRPYVDEIVQATLAWVLPDEERMVFKDDDIDNIMAVAVQAMRDKEEQ